MKDRFEDVAVQVKVLDAIDALERERDPKKRADHKARIDALLNPPGPEADRETDARAGAIAAAVAVPSVPPDHPDHDLRFRQRFAALVEGWPIRRVSERDKRRTPELLFDVAGDRPAPILTAKSGAVLVVGSVAVLAGEGGVSKSALALSIALDAAGTPDGKYHDAPDAVFRVRGSCVLIASFDDHKRVTAWRMRELVKLRACDRDGEACKRLHIIGMKGRPIFGPDARAGHYATRPVELPGWHDLWDAVDVCQPGLVIIDTATASFAGDSTKVAAVHDYLSVLELEAEVRGCGVLVLGHSTKKVRQDSADAKKARRGSGDARQTTKAPDPFNFGHIAGSAAWVDGGRAALSLIFGADRRTRTLAVVKSNYGPSHIVRTLVPQCVSGGDDDGAVVGLRPEQGSVWGPFTGADEGAGADRESDEGNTSGRRNGTRQAHQIDGGEIPYGPVPHGNPYA